MDTARDNKTDTICAEFRESIHATHVFYVTADLVVSFVHEVDQSRLSKLNFSKYV